MFELTEPKQKRQRRWMRVSLRNFLVFVTLVGIALGAWIIPSLRQRQAVHGIKSMGGTVVYDIEPADDDPLYLETPNWLGIDFLHSVKEASVSHSLWPGTQPPAPLDLDGLVSHLERLPKCRSLRLSMIGLGDDDIAKLAPLAGQLESLLISESRGEYGSGLIHIKNWPHLKSLQLYCYTHGQSLDLTSLSTCPKLEQLTLGRAGWVPVGKRCSSRRLQESDFVEIAKCQGITKLSFSDCSFEGVHLVLLQKMESLKSLSLFNCAPRLATDSRRGVPWRIPLNEKPVPTIGAFDFDAYHPNSIASFEEAFPTDHYNDWKKRILPEVEILRRFGLDNF